MATNQPTQLEVVELIKPKHDIVPVNVAVHTLSARALHE